MNPNPTPSPCLVPVAGQGNMFNHLPDELVAHMCRYMDSYSMLKFGRCSSRLYSVVCCPEVWRRLLRGIEDFSEAKVRMLMHFARRGHFLFMMTEVLREIASRNIFSKGEDIVRAKVTIGGWSEAKIYDLRADALKRMYMLEWESALVVPGGAKLVVNEVQEFEGSRRSSTCRARTFGYICDHVKIQDCKVEYFEVGEITGHWDNLHILRKCQKWLIHELCMVNWSNNQLTVEQVQRHWRYLAKSADGGHIKVLAMNTSESRLPEAGSIYDGILDSVRKVWSIADHVKIMLEDRTMILVRAGRSADKREENWQDTLRHLQI